MVKHSGALAIRRNGPRSLGTAREIAARTGWQPIETAPRDGAWVLLRGGKPDWHEENDLDMPPPPCVAASWQDDKAFWCMGIFDGYIRMEYHGPTEWMPSPETP